MSINCVYSSTCIVSSMGQCEWTQSEFIHNYSLI